MEPSEGNPGGGDPVSKDFRNVEPDGYVTDVGTEERQEVLSVVLARLHTALDALRAIVDHRFPCATCGKAHEYRLLKVGDISPHPQMTWSDPEDGHPYAEIPSGKFAQQVLRELEAGE